MAGIIPGPLVDAPEPIGSRYGLFAAAIGPLDLPPHGAGGGVQYVPATCGRAHAWPIVCAGGVVGDTPKQVDEGEETVEADPFTIYATYECGSLGFAGQELQNRALRRLLNGEQGAVEYALWTGTSDVGATALDITSLQNNVSDILIAGNENIEAVVGQLEFAAYHTQGYGNVAYIHAPVSVAAWAASASLVIKDGPRLRTPYGSIWVFGGGYPGTGNNDNPAPDGGAYLHITGQVTVWRSAEPQVFTAAETLNRETNQQVMLAEREYAVGYDCLNIRAVFDPLGEA